MKIGFLINPIAGMGGSVGLKGTDGLQQISAKVIETVGVENVIVLATPHKLSETPVLMVDTGSDELDEKLRGYMSVVCGYRMAQRKEVRKG